MSTRRGEVGPNPSRSGRPGYEWDGLKTRYAPLFQINPVEVGIKQRGIRGNTPFARPGPAPFLDPEPTLILSLIPPVMDDEKIFCIPL